MIVAMEEKKAATMASTCVVWERAGGRAGGRAGSQRHV